MHRKLPEIQSSAVRHIHTQVSNQRTTKEQQRSTVAANHLLHNTRYIFQLRCPKNLPQNMDFQNPKAFAAQQLPERYCSSAATLHDYHLPCWSIWLVKRGAESFVSSQLQPAPHTITPQKLPFVAISLAHAPSPESFLLCCRADAAQPIPTLLLPHAARASDQCRSHSPIRLGAQSLTSLAIGKLRSAGPAAWQLNP